MLEDIPDDIPGCIPFMPDDIPMLEDEAMPEDMLGCIPFMPEIPGDMPFMAGICPVIWFMPIPIPPMQPVLDPCILATRSFILPAWPIQRGVRLAMVAQV